MDHARSGHHDDDARAKPDVESRRMHVHSARQPALGRLPVRRPGQPSRRDVGPGWGDVLPLVSQLLCSSAWCGVSAEHAHPPTSASVDPEQPGHPRHSRPVEGSRRRVRDCALTCMARAERAVCKVPARFGRRASNGRTQPRNPRSRPSHLAPREIRSGRKFVEHVVERHACLVPFPVESEEGLTRYRGDLRLERC
jgi:hypothetical protein